MKQIGLISETPSVDPQLLARVAAAIQKQVLVDLQRFWQQTAVVTWFPSLASMTGGFWPIRIRDDIGHPGTPGLHGDADGRPFGLVQFGESWTLSVSHEVLEMILDPDGRRTELGPRPDASGVGVEYLREICDPVQAIERSYEIDSVRVSAFVTPEFFDVKAPPTSTFCHGAAGPALTAPFTVAPGGYLNFRDPDGSWWQWDFFDAEPMLLRVPAPRGLGFEARHQLVAHARHRGSLGSGARGHPLVRASRAGLRSERNVSQARARALDRRLGEIVRADAPNQPQPLRHARPRRR